MSHQWQLFLSCIAHALALPAQGPGTQWVGINGGYSKDYTDRLGRLWHNSQEKWTPQGWGGWTGIEAPATYTNTWGSPRFQCKNWPPEYDQDFDALLHHYSKEPGSGGALSVRVNLQQEDEPVSYYTVKWNFCEKNWHGGAIMDFWINGKLMKQGYTTKTHHTHTDMYHWKCIPTVNGKIELRIEGKDWEKADSQGIQSRYSSIEFEKSLSGCDMCEGVSCGKGICSASQVWDSVPSTQPWHGHTGIVNEFDREIPSTTSGACQCDVGVSGQMCEIGACAGALCNEPFGGTCNQGICSCTNGYTGAQCNIKPNLDQFGCYPREDVSNGPLQVSTLCLPERIAGPAAFNHIFRGPSPMNTVADRASAATVYFSWTSDHPWGKASKAGMEGRIYISKLLLPNGELPTLSQSTAFNGFVRTGGIDMTEDGHVGTLCAKWFPAWYYAFPQPKGYSPMVLAVCEVKSSDMSARGTPWRIGKQYQETYAGFQSSTGNWGNYPLAGWFEQRSAGYGQLQYSPHHRTWTAWYGASVGTHTGYAMHTYSAEAPTVSDEVYSKYEHPVPRDQVESRVEMFGAFSGGGRLGTGDHQGGSAWRYHPILKDIGLQKHNHGNVYMQQYGLETPAGKFAPPGHGSGRVDVSKGNQAAIQEGSIRPCADGWIAGLVATDGNVCAKIDKFGNISTWQVIETSVSKMPCNPLGHNCGDQIPGRMVRIAPLGAAENATLCGSSARFLYGYEKEDRSRWLVEVDGDCNELQGTRQDVTAYTHWPLYQEWTTTVDGSVVWVTSWHMDEAGKFGPKNSPNGIDVYDPQPATQQDGVFLDDQNGYKFGATPDATNEAKITVYYPNHVFSTVTTSTMIPPSTTSGPLTTTFTTTATSPYSCVPGFQFSHFGYWGNAFALQPPFGRRVGKTGTTEPQCASECNAVSGCVGFNLFNNHGCWVYDTVVNRVSNSASIACLRAESTTTTTTAPTVTSTIVESGIQSGDTVFLKTHSGSGHHVDVQGSIVQARWESRGQWQALVIEKEGGGAIQSGDVVFLRTHKDIHIDITGVNVQARWNDRSGWQALVIEKRTGSGAILPNDLVCFKSQNTGKHLDVQDDTLRARYDDCGDWQTMLLEKEVVGAVFSGDLIHLAAYTGKRIEIEGTSVQARWSEKGWWQTLTIQGKYGGRVLYSGDVIFLKAHTDNLLDVQDVDVQARWAEQGVWQELVLERKDGAGPVLPGDTIFLRTHTGNVIDVQGVDVRARWNDLGVWQALVIEKYSDVSQRRLLWTAAETLLV